MGRHRRRLSGVWLAAERFRRAGGRRGDVTGVFPAGAAHDLGVHRHDGGGVVAETTGLLRKTGDLNSLRF